MIKNGHFYENVISIITPTGEVIDMKRNPSESMHGEVFARVDEVDPSLLEEFEMDRTRSGGFDYAAYLAANGNVVFWPTNINDNDIMIISLPKTPTLDQIKEIKRLIKELKEMEVYVSICSFKNMRSKKVKAETLSGNGEFLSAYEKTIEYLKNIEMLESMLSDLETQEVDLSEYMKSN